MSLGASERMTVLQLMVDNTEPSQYIETSREGVLMWLSDIGQQTNQSDGRRAAGFAVQGNSSTAQRRHDSSAAQQDLRLGWLQIRCARNRENDIII